jgi:hypothetical protein
MKNRHVFYFAFAAALVGCAGEQNKNAATAAETRLTSEEQAKRNEEEIRARQARERQDLERKQQEEQADLASGQRQERTEARADTERATFETRAKARLESIDAKAEELRTKSVRLQGKKRANFSAQWDRYTAKKKEVEDRMTKAPSVSEEQWPVAKIDIEKTLDDLAKMVDHLERSL